MVKKIRIAVLDSGFRKDQNIKKAYTIINKEDSFLVTSEESEDKLGHGTAIIGILCDNLSTDNVEIISIKIYDNELIIDENKFIFSLEYVLNFVSCDILHISSGIVLVEQYAKMYDICYQIYRKGTIIVSAFDNEGALSYPAAFPFVVGVDMSDNRSLGKEEYEFVDSPIINIRTSSCSKRVQWISFNTMIVWGSSFSSVDITIRIAKLLMDFDCVTTLNNILNKLRKYAKYVYKNNSIAQKSPDRVLKIKKAIVFPFNKEVHSLARYEDGLKCEIMGFYDTKYSGIIGKTIKSLLHVQSKHIIRNIDQINWLEDFDTIILGHCTDLNNLSKIDWIEKIVELAYLHNKAIYSFESINSYIEKYDNFTLYEYPTTTVNMIPYHRFGKLRIIGKPILSVFGTSSQQGKYTLQLYLRQQLQLLGYKVGQLGTEPTGKLFGFDKVFPIGYHSDICFSGYQTVTLINEYLWEISVQNPEPDIILVGGQSGTVPYDYDHLSQLPLPELEFLIGVHPDCSIICINPHDPLDYIERTIKAIESLSDNPVLALVMFPLKLIDSKNWMKLKKVRIDENEVLESKKNITEFTGKPVYLLDLKPDMDKLIKDILEFFSEN